MRALLIVLLGSSLLAACGGGGGSAGTTPTAGYLSITASNQDAVGRAGVTASTTLLGAGGGVGGGNSVAPGGASTLALQGGATTAGTSLGSLAMLVGRTIAGDSVARRNPQAVDTAGAPARRLAIPSSTDPCTVSGSITVSFADSDNNSTLSAGDTMTLTFHQCHETATDSINGSVAIALSQIGVNNGLISFSGSLAMQMTLTDGARTATLNGTVTMSFAEHSATETQVQLVVSAAGLASSVNGGGLADSITFEESFVMIDTETTSTTPGGSSYSSATINGTLSASSIGGRVTLQTTAPLLQLDSEAYPRSGEVVITGNASALRLHVIDATSVRVELDANHDGTYEASKDVPWATLLPG